jgi:hypothetical protein
LLLLYPAEVIDLAEMIVQMVQELDQNVSMGIFRTVELDRKFGFHLVIGDVAKGGGDQRDKLFKLSNQLLPGNDGGRRRRRRQRRLRKRRQPHRR